ncbi:MAG: hypothetical protein Q9Q13_13165 [Acidobacteriota bacterium]|nr:hypothetical protein [Acidobacteriota bacterium]
MVEGQIDQEEGQTADVVAVEVGQHHRFEPGGIEARAAQAHQRRGAEIHHHGAGGGLEPVAGVSATGGVVGISRANDHQAHRQPPI